MVVSGKPRHMYKMKKWSSYHEKSVNLNPLYSSSAFKEVSNPPGSMINTNYIPQNLLDSSQNSVSNKLEH